MDRRDPGGVVAIDTCGRAGSGADLEPPGIFRMVGVCAGHGSVIHSRRGDIVASLEHIAPLSWDVGAVGNDHRISRLLDLDGSR
jgi:hypothetical protein